MCDTCVCGYFHSSSVSQFIAGCGEVLEETASQPVVCPQHRQLARRGQSLNVHREGLGLKAAFLLHLHKQIVTDISHGCLNLKDEGENFANSERTEKPGHYPQSPRCVPMNYVISCTAGLQKALTMNNI